MAIEHSCNVPACVQELSFESHPLSAKDDVKLARIRSGDTINVRYLAEGDCILPSETQLNYGSLLWTKIGYSIRNMAILHLRM